MRAEADLSLSGGEFNKNIAIARGLVMAGLALSTVLIGGCAAKAETPKPTATAEAPANPNQTAVNASETATPESKTDKYDSAMEKYANMSIEGFDSLPRDERLLYAEYVIDQSVANSDYDDTYGSGAAKEFEIKPVKASANNNGQEIINNHIYTFQLSLLQFVVGEEKPFDLKDAEKVLSAAYYEVGSRPVVAQEYLDNRKTEKGLSEKEPSTIAITNVKATALNTSDMMEGRDLDGNKVKYKVVTYYNENAKTMYAKFVYHEFTNYDGSRESVWLMDISDYSMDGLDAHGSVK